MEDNETTLPLTGTNFTKQCCDNVVTYYGIYNNYFPSFTFVPESFQYNFQSFALPSVFSLNSSAYLIPSYTNGSPPGMLMSTSVDLSDICVFRI